MPSPSTTTHDPVLDAEALVQTDRAAGLRALETLAQGGERRAVSALGRALYERREARAEAMAWLMRAAAFGDAGAAWMVAMIHREGQRMADMRSWIDRAARLGDEGAKWVRRTGYDLDLFPDFFT